MAAATARSRAARARRRAPGSTPRPPAEAGSITRWSDRPPLVQGADAAAEVGHAHPREPGLAHQAGEALLIGEAPDAFDQVLVGAAVAGHHRADGRNDPERI